MELYIIVYITHYLHNIMELYKNLYIFIYIISLLLHSFIRQWTFNLFPCLTVVNNVAVG